MDIHRATTRAPKAHAPAGCHTPTDHGYLHSVESGAAVDGPGMRFVFFMAGCLFRCIYCHNPDTWKLHNGRKITLDDAMNEIRPYGGFLRMAGGVTISGGEPMMQAPFVGEIFRQIKSELGLHTALDTQGYLHATVDDEWFDAVDLVLLDIKHIDPEVYQRLTAQPLQPTLDFAHRLVRLNKPMWLRYVLVPGWTDGYDDISRLADFVAGLGPIVERVEVLPFHQMGTHKWEQLGMAYPLAGAPTPTPESTAEARKIFAERGLTVF
jgi:pyruvate formate lyase activating enzyme